MAKVLVVGAGGVGRVVVHRCAAHSRVFNDILLASRSLGPCKQIAEAVAKRYGINIKTAPLDADDLESCKQLMHDFAPDILIHVALPYQNLTLMNACLEAGVHYLDTANYEPRNEAAFAYHWQWAYHERFEKAGLTALLGCGFDPGVTGVFTAYAIKHHVHTPLKLDIIDCNDGVHDHPFATNFNAEINIREITQEGKYYDKGKWLTIPPHTLSRMIDYPAIGARKSYVIYHEELESLVKHFPTLQSARFWMTFGDEYLRHLRVIMNLGMGSIVPITYQGRDIVPLSFLQAVLPKNEALAKNYAGQTSIGCHVSGTTNGHPISCYLYNNTKHEEAFEQTGAQAVAFTTGVPAVLAARLLVEKIWQPGAGVFNIEQCPPDPFLEALPKEGLPWQKECTTETPFFGDFSP